MQENVTKGKILTSLNSLTCISGNPVVFVKISCRKEGHPGAMKVDSGLEFGPGMAICCGFLKLKLHFKRKVK